MVTQLLGGMAFAFFALQFLKDSSLKQFSIAVFVYLLLTKCEALFNPPYGDPISGPWVEGIWLARHNFDYAGLLSQGGMSQGGPRIYVFSIYPGFLAVLMKLMPSVKIFLLVNHLLTFAMSSVIVAIVREIGKKYFTAEMALLVSMIGLGLPLFQSHTEAINMEMPSLFFLMLTVYALSKRRFGAAVILAILDVLTKGTGLIACATVMMAAVLDAVLGEGTAQAKKKNLILGASLIGFMVVQTGLKYVAQDSTIRDMAFMSGWAAITSTHIFKLFILCFAVCVAVFALRCKGRQPLDVLKGLWKKYYSAILMFLAAFNWLLLFLNMAGLSPRYKIMLCGLLVFCLAFAVSLVLRSKQWMNSILWFALGMSLLSSYGLLENRTTDSHYYEYLLLDRSLEYRNDLKMYQKVAQELENKFSGFTVGAPYIMAQKLGLPELGYVHKPLKVISYAATVEFEDIHTFTILEDIDALHTVWVGFKGKINSGVAEMIPDFPIDPAMDLVLERAGWGGRYATLFMGGYAIDRYQKTILYLFKSGQLLSGRERYRK